jgi:hypothetical protein
VLEILFGVDDVLKMAVVAKSAQQKLISSAPQNPLALDATSARWLSPAGGRSCLIKFASEIRRSRSRRVVGEATQFVLQLFAAQLHWRASPGMRKRTKAVPVNLNANLSASLDARADLALALPTYTFATPVLGAQATIGVLGVYGRTDTSLAATLSGSLTTPFGTLPFSRSDSISDAVTGFGDVYPLATLRWNNGVHNVMTYVFGDVPVGAYDSARLANIGIGHGAIDVGGGYTYLNPQTGHELSGVLGFTYNFINQSTQYQNGVDMHFDWGASQFLTKQFQVGLSAMCIKRSVATAAPATGWDAFSRKWWA